MSSDNSKPVLSAGVKVCFGLAIDTAKQQGHEYLTVEHLLFALLHDPDTKDIIAQCGGEIDELKARILGFLAEQPIKRNLSGDYTPEETLSLKRVVHRAMAHSISCEKNYIDGGDILAAMYQEKDSFAIFFLSEQGISRFDIINYIAHKISKDGNDFDFADPFSNPLEFEGGKVSRPIPRIC